MSLGMYAFVAAIIFILLNAIKVAREYERAVIFRLGRLIALKGPGIFILVPGIDRMVKVSLRLVTMDVPPQDVITRDNVSVKVNAVVYFRVLDPQKAVVEVEDFLYATSQLAQTTLRSVLGQADLDELLAASLRTAATAHPEGEGGPFLVEAGRELARLLAGDPVRLEGLLRRLRPE